MYPVNFFDAKLKSALGFVILIFMLNSCKHKTNFESLTEVSYASDISPIISSNCAFSGCHGDSLYEEFSLTSYQGLMNGGIKANSPQNSKLYTCIKTLNKEEIMPKPPYNELTEKQIQLIYVWIGQGAKNN